MKILSKVFLKKDFLRKARVIKTVFSLADPKGLAKLFQSHLREILMVSTGVIRVSPRLRHFHKFISILTRTYSHHGALYTVKWLKASHTAIQRQISGQPFRSLREIEPELPLPRLINGLPAFIGTMDRAMIRKGHNPTIRMWLSVLNIYRVLDAPYKPKLNTITDPFKGSEVYIDVITHTFWMSLKTLRSNFPSTRNLSPESLVSHHVRLSTRASPNGVAWTSFITDALSVSRYSDVESFLKEWLTLTGSSKLLALFEKAVRCGRYWHRSDNWEDVLKFPQVIEDYEVVKGKLKAIWGTGHFTDLYPGRLVGLPEPAGKLRVIALVDSWTQSAFLPLHKSLFRILKEIPNDGTFDQDASAKRSAIKAAESGQVYSVDLSAATDRLPIRLQENILNLLFGSNIGSLWRGILNRPFVIRKKIVPEMVDGEVIRYGTGQPMGCLSSWAMLAMTHHVILQHCASNILGLGSWHECYEILGDDLVIFNKDVYLEYLRVMQLLDVGTNPSKSLVSDSSQVFEFAKRTVNKGVEVSGMSWQQFITSSGTKMRFNLILALGLKGLLWRDGLLAKLLVPSFKGNHNIKVLSNDKTAGIMMSLVSYFANKGIISFEHAIAYVVDPSKGEVTDLVSLPWKQTLHDIVTLLLREAHKEDFDLPVEDLCVVSNLEKRLKIGADRVVNPLGISIYNQVLDQVDSLNDKVVKVTELFMYSQINNCKFISDTPWGSRSPGQYKLDNFLRELANSALYDDSSSDVSDDLLDFNKEVGHLPPLPSILSFRDKVEGEVSRYNFLNQTKSGRDLELGPASWLLSDISRAAPRIAAVPVLDNITIDDDNHHDPFVGTWDVIIPPGWKKS
jgi:hypothetical protein